VRDRDRAATNIRGVVRVQQFHRATAVGPASLVSYSLIPDGVSDARLESGDARRSTYVHEFVVPQYGPATRTTWRVTEVTIADDRDHETRVTGRELARHDARTVATGLADTTAAAGRVGLDVEQEEFAYDPGSGVRLRYSVSASDDQAGIWKGRLVLAGPGGAEATVAFEVEDAGGYYLRCGDNELVVFPQDVICDVAVTLPPGSPAGAWTVSALDLTDNAGNSVRLTDVAARPVRVTRNEVLSASDFAVDPAVVDNWRGQRHVTVAARAAGAQGGLQRLVVRTDRCHDVDVVPTMTEDGTATARLVVSEFMSRCVITGIALVDGAGNAAVYGSRFGAPPPLDLVIERLPDTVPPVAVAATLTRTTVPTSEVGDTVGVVITVDTTSPAPVESFSVTAYDADGVSVGGSGGGIHEPADGVLRVAAYVYGLPPGVYTVGFTLTDAAGQSSHYGYPSGAGQPAPNGPLVLTVTDG
jgi:hypothetical protein